MPRPKKYANDAERKEAAAARQKKRLQEETAEQRQLRLQKDRDAKRFKPAENEEQRRERLDNKNRLQRSSREAESDEQRQLRNKKNAECYKKRRNEALQQAKTNLQRLSYDMMEDENIVEEHYIGPLNVICSSCNAKHFQAENPDKDGKFTLCCSKGKVFLPEPEKKYPTTLENLMTKKHKDSENFMENIRAINSSFGFASMGADIAPPPGFGPYCFRIHGQIYHTTGNYLHPDPGQPRKYAQIYILDNESATEERLGHHANLKINKNLMQEIAEIMAKDNEFAKSFRMLHEVEKDCIDKANANNEELPNVCMAIIQDRSKDKRRYNKSKDETEVAVVFEDDDGKPPTDRDILVHLRPDPKDPTARRTKRINILDPN